MHVVNAYKHMFSTCAYYCHFQLSVPRSLKLQLEMFVDETLKQVKNPLSEVSTCIRVAMDI